MSIALIIIIIASIYFIFVFESYFKQNKSKYQNFAYLTVLFPFISAFEIISAVTSIVISLVLFAIAAFMSGYFDSKLKKEKGIEKANIGRYIDDLGKPFNPIGTYEFNYENMQGSVSRRVVDVHKIFYGKNNTGYFSGYCHQAGDYRTFRLDSVFGDVIDMKTGEVITL